MLAAGTGIAPMLQVIQGILANEDDETFLHLVYSSQRYADILMKDTLDEMKAFWNFSVLYIVTKVSEYSQYHFLSVCTCIPTTLYLQHPSPFQNAITVLSSYLLISLKAQSRS